MAVSLVLCQKLLQSYFTPDVFTTDEQLYIALTATIGLPNSPGELLDEPNAGAYARCAVALTSDNWALSGTGDLYNIVDLDFPQPNTDEDWGYLSAWAMLDAPTGGTVLAVGPLITATNFTADQPPLSMGPGQITISAYPA